MYQSLKKQKRVHGPTRRTISAAPIKSGRGESTIASSDEGELLAISTAMRKGRPLYFIRTDDGVTLDVLLDKPAAIKRRDAIIDRQQNGPARVRLYERKHTALVPVY
jgi:hypothetical protein